MDSIPAHGDLEAGPCWESWRPRRARRWRRRRGRHGSAYASPMASTAKIVACVRRPATPEGKDLIRRSGMFSIQPTPAVTLRWYSPATATRARKSGPVPTQEAQQHAAGSRKPSPSSGSLTSSCSLLMQEDLLVRLRAVAGVDDAVLCVLDQFHRHPIHTFTSSTNYQFREDQIARMHSPRNEGCTGSPGAPSTQYHLSVTLSSLNSSLISSSQHFPPRNPGLTMSEVRASERPVCGRADRIAHGRRSAIRTSARDNGFSDGARLDRPLTDTFSM